MIQDHHRGIAIAPLLGKVLEIVCMRSGYGKLPNNKLQFGFTDERAPTMASLTVTEACADARINKTALYGAPLDGKKSLRRSQPHNSQDQAFPDRDQPQLMERDR